MYEKNYHRVKIETEVKFIIPDQATLAALKKVTSLDDFQLQSIGTKSLVDRYLDTSDKRLFRAGYACRIRTTPQKQTFALKSLTPPEGNIHRRQEFEMEVESDQPQTWAKGEAKDLVLGIIGEQQLHSLFTIYQTRHKYHGRLGEEPIIELSLDEVSVNDAGKTDYFELEAELLESGSEDDLGRFVDALQANWDLQPEVQSKFERALASIENVGKEEDDYNRR